jgi:branched-subunit amino acid transport protein
MELFGVVFSVPAAFLASIVYAALLKRLPLPEQLKRLAKWISAGVLAALVVEWVLLLTIGPVRCRATLGPAFYAAHVVVFLLAIPSLVNLLVLARRETAWSSWVAVGVLSAVLALPVVLTQYGVSEALYGVNGDEGPYSAP